MPGSLYGRSCHNLVCPPAGLMDAKLAKTLRSMTCLWGTLKDFIKNNNESLFRRSFCNKKDKDKSIEDDVTKDFNKMYEVMPQSFDAYFQTLLEFPFDKLKQEITELSMNSELRILIIWARDDVVVPYKPTFKRWRKILNKGKCYFHYKIIYRANHMFIAEEHVEICNQVVEFLK